MIISTSSADYDDEPLEPETLWQFIVAHPGGQHTYRPQSYGHRLAEHFRFVSLGTTPARYWR